MTTPNEHLNTLNDIKQMMERSSRFISLSGLSGIAAGTCALVGAWFAKAVLNNSPYLLDENYRNINTNNRYDKLYELGVLNPAYHYEIVRDKLLLIALLTFAAAFTLSFIFTYLRSKKTNTPIWGTTAKRLMLNVTIPMAVGGIFILKLLAMGNFGLVAPSCLLFYGLALVHASKYTLIEVKYLGYCQLLLGIVNLWFVGKGIYFWAVGFGLLHIIYGIIMWYKYEKNT